MDRFHINRTTAKENEVETCLKMQLYVCEQTESPTLLGAVFKTTTEFLPGTRLSSTSETDSGNIERGNRTRMTNHMRAVCCIYCGTEFAVTRQHTRCQTAACKYCSRDTKINGRP